MRLGNDPIRRPPNSGESSCTNSSGGGGYASSSGYSSGSSNIALNVRHGHDADADNDNNSAERNASSGSGNGTNRNSNSNSNSGRYSRSASFSSNMEQIQIARLFFFLACLWPLIFLLIPPNTSHSSHRMALLSTGMMDTMDSHSLSQHMSHFEKTTHDKIDKLRYKVSSSISAKEEYLKKEMKSLLRRSDVVGYGASKPRVAVVVVVPPPSTPNADFHDYEEQQLLHGALEAVESIFRSTDRNRIFIVTVVMDGRGKVGTFESRLQDIDAGRTSHRHGSSVHTHDHHEDSSWNNMMKGYEQNDKANNKGGKGEVEKDETKKETHAHSEKIHTIYNHESMGVSASRKEAVQFINILSKKHEEAGLKPPEEDLILLLLRCDARLREFEGKKTWLDDVTDALILTPSLDDTSGLASGSMMGNDAKKSKNAQMSPPANAVSFVIDYSFTDTEGNVEIIDSQMGTTLSFDQSLHPIPAMASGQDMSLSNGESYPAPLTAVATALRLETYNAFPASDDMLVNHYGADLELSFNLWMCADGIDVLGSSFARVVVDPLVLSPYEKAKLPGPLAARIVSAWMSGHEDEGFGNGILRAVAESSAVAWQHKQMRMEQHPNNKDHTLSENRVLLDKTQELNHVLVRIASEAKQSATFPSGLDKKCRPFSWYAEHVHPKMIEFHEGGETDASILQAEMMHQPVKSAEKLIPSQPLGEENMSIISKAAPVKLAYVDASGGHIAHPHKGATDENGIFGYVHDETALYKNPPPFEFKDDDQHSSLCKKGDPNWQMLTEKVYVDLTNHEAAEKRAEHGLAKKKRAKIFCLVYTIEKYHDRIPPIRETWGQKCDGFMVASTKTDTNLGTVNIPHEGPEEYNNIWQKVRSMWSYIYDNYYEKYDYFHIGGDDLYLIVENLRLYLESEEIQLASNGGHYLPDGSEDMQTPLFMGRRFAEGGNRDRMFISGGSGYTMNKAALKALVVDGFPQCFPHMKTFSEDVMGATCFRKMDILPYNTKDEAGGERYMPFQPGHHLTYRPPKNPKDDWYSNYSVDCKWGMDHCAAKSVAFHYIKEDLMKRMHAILYHHC